jgi:hypothetical protein
VAQKAIDNGLAFGFVAPQGQAQTAPNRPGQGYPAGRIPPQTPPIKGHGAVHRVYGFVEIKHIHVYHYIRLWEGCQLFAPTIDIEPKKEADFQKPTSSHDSSLGQFLVYRRVGTVTRHQRSVNF